MQLQGRCFCHQGKVSCGEVVRLWTSRDCKFCSLRREDRLVCMALGQADQNCPPRAA